jgi:hypothetical protein
MNGRSVIGRMDRGTRMFVAIKQNWTTKRFLVTLSL